MTHSSDVLAAERRRNPRTAVSRVVTVEPSPNVPSYEALVTNISRGGARLFVRDIELPESFAVIFNDTRERRECRVVWRVGPEMGVEFTDRPPTRRLRSVAEPAAPPATKRSR